MSRLRYLAFLSPLIVLGLHGLPLEMFSIPFRQVLSAPAFLTWSLFVLIWSVFVQGFDQRAPVFAMLLAGAWGASSQDWWLPLLMGSALWALIAWSWEPWPWVSLHIFILDAIWLWYRPFFFPTWSDVALGPASVASKASVGMFDLWVSLSLVMVVTGLGQYLKAQQVKLSSSTR